MTKHTHPYPGPKNRCSDAALRFFNVLAAVPFVYALILIFSGCAAQTAATVNRDITAVIAGAGAAANQAEQEYQNKTISQTPAARNAINTLGAAYEQARAAYVIYLDAEKVYQAAEDLQLRACTPSLTAANPGSAANCQATAQSATAAQSKLQATQNDLNNMIANLAHQTRAVQALK